MEVVGTIKLIEDTQTFGAKGFRKRGVAVTTEEQYPQTIMVEFVQDKTDLLDTFEVGDSVKVGINLRGREWVDPKGVVKYFNTIQGWRIDKVSGGGNSTPQPPKDVFEPETDFDDNEDDLPFN